jgi:hypothetical protein
MFPERSCDTTIRFHLDYFLRWRDEIIESCEFANMFDVAEQVLGRFLMP